MDDQFSDNREPEASGDEYNDISDYDTSEEDQLLADDVDLSLGKTKSAQNVLKSKYDLGIPRIRIRSHHLFRLLRPKCPQRPQGRQRGPQPRSVQTRRLN